MTCVISIWRNGDWHPSRCSKPDKEVIEIERKNGQRHDIRVCGLHAKMLRKGETLQVAVSVDKFGHVQSEWVSMVLTPKLEREKKIRKLEEEYKSTCERMVDMRKAHSAAFFQFAKIVLQREPTEQERNFVREGVNIVQSYEDKAVAIREEIDALRNVQNGGG